jgi:hypothetical protein
MCDSDVNPWIPLRVQPGGQRGVRRSYIEEYYGDLLALESLYQAIIEGAAAAAKVLHRHPDPEGPGPEHCQQHYRAD